MVGHLDREFGVESVILSHYVERQYGPRAMHALRQILGLASLLDQLGSRPPAPSFPALTRRQVAAKCAACPFHPKTLFGALRSKMGDGFPDFHGAFIDVTEKLNRYREPGCKTCVSATTNDLFHLFRVTSTFGEDAVRASPPEEVVR